MKKVLATLFLVFFMSVSLFAGGTWKIFKGDENFKKLIVSFEQAVSLKDQNKISVTVKVKANYQVNDLMMMIGKINLLTNEKNHELEAEIKDDMATINFEVEKEHLEKASLIFNYSKSTRCPPSYSLDLKDFVK